MHLWHVMRENVCYRQFRYYATENDLGKFTNLYAVYIDFKRTFLTINLINLN